MRSSTCSAPCSSARARKLESMEARLADLEKVVLVQVVSGRPRRAPAWCGLVALASLLSRGQAGLDAYLVTVEVHLAGGLPGFAVTGLPAAAVRESKDRVRAALATSGYAVPVEPHHGASRAGRHPETGRALRPRDRARRAARAREAARGAIGALEFLGELALNGDLRPITGALPAVLAARRTAARSCCRRRTPARPRS